MSAATSILGRVARVINPAWLTGPIFEKELRVSSRRKRNYLLRVAYLALLALFVVPTWLVTDRMSRSYSIARMSDLGRSITITVAWFQFCALPFVAVILCSTSVSDEIYRRTLGVLMTTPINSFQIVMGKLLSRMFQLLVLLAISLPLLAIVRVFGGVPWDFLVTSLCITLTAVVFCGSISMFFSIGNRHAYLAILKTFGLLILLFAVVPWVVGLLAWASQWRNPEPFFTFLYYFNPGMAMIVSSESLMGGRGSGFSGFTPSWEGHCLTMLGMSAVILLLCVKRVRKAALGQMSGGDSASTSFVPEPPLMALPVGESLPFTSRPLPAPSATDLGWRERPVAAISTEQSAIAEAAMPISRVQAAPSGTIRPVTDHPVIWKELRPPPSKRRVRSIVSWVLLALVVLLLYVTLGCNDALGYSATQAMLVSLLLLCGLVSTAVNSATMITTEREANSWPILLTTTLTGWDILFGKAVGVLRRTLALWAVLLTHLLIFGLAGATTPGPDNTVIFDNRRHFIPPEAIPWLILEIAGLVFFLTCSGLFFSARMKRTSTAVVMNLMLGIGLWIVLPIATMMNMHSYSGIELWYLNPLVQAGGLIAGPSPPSSEHGTIIDWVIGSTVGYLFVGTLFFLAAATNLRRRIF